MPEQWQQFERDQSEYGKEIAKSTRGKQRV
jgi:hypothetical protein